MNTLFENEKKLYETRGILAGIDEAGRGPLAGPVVVAAVILKPNCIIDDLNDSKKISEKKRDKLFEIIKKECLAYNIQIISNKIIDELNILGATLKGMADSANLLKIKPDLCLIDGNKLPKDIIYKAEAIIKGDSKFACISAASILAKVTRDKLMKQYHNIYPVYNFKKNKGYPTSEHLIAIRRYGISPIHRKSFKPVGQSEIDFDRLYLL